MEGQMMQDHALNTAAYQQMRSPLYPQSTLSTDERLALYKHKYEQQESAASTGSGEQVDPFVPQQSTTVDPKDRLEEADKWLAPVASDVSTPSAPTSGKDYDHFVEQLHSDPAIHEIYGMIAGDESNQGLAPALRDAVQSGQMSQDDAMAFAQKVVDEHIKPIIEKHHKETQGRPLFRTESDADKYGISKSAINGGF